MKEIINPYKATPSARPTKIKDLPRMEESSLMAPRAAEAEEATAMPPPAALPDYGAQGSLSERLQAILHSL